MDLDNKSFFDVPILFIVFTRLDTTQQVFQRIKQIRPKRLYVASDGARKDKKGEAEKVIEVREYLEKNIDWPCELITRYQQKNLGCKYNPQGAISWFFEQEEMGIILEDDCLPSLSFFSYCKDLLEKYKDDLRVWGVSGTNLQPDILVENSYYFSEFFMTWGWASWRNRWKRHEEMLKDFPSYLNDSLVLKKLKNTTANKKMVHRAKISFEDKLDAWDYQWIFSCFANNALLATPTKNLIQNIGFGDGATHTSGARGNQVKENEIEFPLKHPLIIHANQAIDNSFFIRIFGWQSDFKKYTSPHYLSKAIRVRLKKTLFFIN